MSKLLGNRKNLEYLKDAARSNRLSHAYIISGEEGKGKKTFAGHIARTLLCENMTVSFTPCGGCAACIRSMSGNHPDIKKVTHIKESVLSVDEVREQIVNDIYIKPYYGPYKIYIVNDAHLIQEEGQNALLKTIEEPPEYAIILLLTNNGDALLDTIRSRCIRLDMEALDTSILENELIKRGVASGDAQAVASYCGGNLGEALRISETAENGEFIKETADFLFNIKSKDAAQISEESKKLGEYPAGQALELFRKWYRDVLLCKASKNDKLYFPKRKTDVKKAAFDFSWEGLNNIFTDIDEAEERLKFSVKAEAVYETLLLRIRRNG